MKQAGKFLKKCADFYLSCRLLRIGLFLILIWRWLSVLSSSDAYFSPYILCAIIGFMAFVSNTTGRDTRKTAKRSNRDRIWICLFSVLFSLAVLCSNYALITPPGEHLFRILLMLAAGCVIAGNILVWILDKRAARAQRQLNIRKRGAKRVFFITFVCIIAVDCLYLFFCHYPGLITADSVSQIGQVLKDSYSNHHPFWHTMIIRACIKTGLILFEDMNSACAVYGVFQIVCMAAVFAFLTMTLYQAGMPKGWLIITIAVYVMIPYHILYSFAMWKDVLFAGMVALFGCAIYRILKGIGSNAANYITLVLGTVGFALLRSNGWIALLITSVYAAFIFGKKYRRVTFIILGLLAMTFILKHPVLNLMNIRQPDTVEHLSIPEQQIARLVVEDAELTAEEKKKIEKVMGIEEAKDNYEPYISDPIKAVIRGSGQKYLNKHKMEYLTLWLNLGFRYPELYFEAWVDQTKGYWNGGYSYPVAEMSIYYNEYDIYEDPPAGWVTDALSAWRDVFLEGSLFEPFRSIGLHVWAVALMLFILVIEKRKTRIIPASLLAIILTLLISTPVFSEFRYAYALFALFPFVIFVTYADTGTEPLPGKLSK